MNAILIQSHCARIGDQVIAGTWTLEITDIQDSPIGMVRFHYGETGSECFWPDELVLIKERLD